MPSCRAMASPDHPWRRSAHTCSSVASRRARRWLASSWAVGAGGWQWDGDGHSAIRLADRGLTHRLMDRREHRAMRTAHLLQGLGHILEQVKTVRDLGRLGCALPCTVRVGF